MKFLITGLFFFISNLGTGYSSLYDISFNTIDGNAKQISEFEGKKIVVIILPLTQTDSDSIFLTSLDSLSRGKAGSANFIGVCSYEDGFSDSLKVATNTYYRSILGNQITITEGMYTRKGTQQHALFDWLTSKENNTHFDDDANGPGQKYFIDEQGELIGIYGADVPIAGRHVLRILQ